MVDPALSRTIDEFAHDPLGALRDAAERGEPVTITRDGQSTAVLQDFATFKAAQEQLALLTLLARGDADIAAGRTRPIRDVLGDLKAGRVAG